MNKKGVDTVSKNETKIKMSIERFRHKLKWSSKMQKEHETRSEEALSN
jgi:hypothetical protein